MISWGCPGSLWRGPLVGDVAPEKAWKIGRHCFQEPTVGTQTNTCAPVFMAALFTPVKSGANASVYQEISKMWSIPTMEYHSALKRKEILT